MGRETGGGSSGVSPAHLGFLLATAPAPLLGFKGSDTWPGGDLCCLHGPLEAGRAAVQEWGRLGSVASTLGSWKGWTATWGFMAGVRLPQSWVFWWGLEEGRALGDLLGLGGRV